MPFDISYTSASKVKRVKPFSLDEYKRKRRKRILAGLPPEPPRVQQREKDDE